METKTKSVSKQTQNNTNKDKITDNNTNKDITTPKKQNVEVLYITVIILMIFIFIFIMVEIFHKQKEVPKEVSYYIYKPNYNKKFELPEDYDVATQGRQWSNWDTDEKGITKICTLFNYSMGYFQSLNHYDDLSGLKIIEDWIGAFLVALEKSLIVNPNFQGFPWGGNWYEFSIIAPVTLAYYIVNKHSLQSVANSAAKAIQYIIISPTRSLGYDRKGINSAMMLMPWLISHMVTKTLDDTNSSYLYAIKQYDLSPITYCTTQDGVHMDYSYLTHNGVYLYGYIDVIAEIYPDIIQLVPDIKKYRLVQNVDVINAIFKHPTIPLSGGGLYHQREDIKMGLYKGIKQNRAIEIMITMPYVRFFTDKFQWCAKGTNQYSTEVAWYESDKNVNNMGLFTQFCRHVFKAGDSPKTDRPLTGFLWRNINDFKRQVPHSSLTTQRHYATKVSEDATFLYTDYTSYLEMYSALSKFIWFDGEEVVGERIQIDIRRKLIEIHFRVFKTGINFKFQVGDEQYPLVSGEKGIVYNIDMNTGTYTVLAKPQLTREKFGFNVIKLNDIDNRTLILKHGKPYSVSPGKRLTSGVENIKYNDITYKFQYNRNMRQIMCINN